MGTNIFYWAKLILVYFLVFVLVLVVVIGDGAHGT